MTILVISGPPSSGKTMIATALRNNQITQQKSALLIDEQQDGELQHLIEKIIDGTVTMPGALKPGVLVPGTAASAIAWKPEPLIILVGAKESMLAQIDDMVPGFVAKHGPVLRLATTKS